MPSKGDQETKTRRRADSGSMRDAGSVEQRFLLMSTEAMLSMLRRWDRMQWNEEVVVGEDGWRERMEED